MLGRAVVILIRAVEEIVPVANGLDEDEGEIEDQRYRADEDELNRRVDRAEGRDGVVRQHQRQRRQRAQHGQRRGGALELERLLVVKPGAEDKAQSDNAVGDDHHGREHGVAGDGVAAGHAGDEDRHDEGDLDHRHRDGKEKRSERLAKASREHFRVMHRREHRAAEKDGGEGEDDARLGRNQPDEFQRRAAMRRGPARSSVQAGKAS